MPSQTEWLWIGGSLAGIAFIELLSRTPIWPRVTKYLGGPNPDYPKPVLVEDESALREGAMAFTRGLHGGRGGRLVLTNRRVIWYEDRLGIIWPVKRKSGEVNLSEIASVDQGLVLAHIFGGRRLWLRLRNGECQGFWVDQLDDWIEAIKAAAGTSN
jgi:hypothetical protein